MNLKQFKYVLMLAQEGSFSRAAENLNISQPSLSQYIKNIEQQVGVALFDRVSGEVRLTDAGRVYIDAGRRILDLERQMENRFSDIASFKGGTITIGISPYRSVHMIPTLLKEFDKFYPNIKLIVKERSGRELIEAAEHGEFDLCVIALPVENKNFQIEKICSEEILLAVNTESEFYKKINTRAELLPNKKFPAVDIGIVDGEPFAKLGAYMPMRIVTEKLLDEYNIRVLDKIEVSSNEALLSIVGSGVCAAFVPSGVSNQADSKIAFFSIKQDVEFRDVAILYRKEQYLSKPMKKVIDIFKAF